MTSFLIYGANGYTGRLAAEHAAASGLRPIVAGRSRDDVEALAKRLSLEHRVFDLHAPKGILDGISGTSAVLHAAGPFSATSRPMVDACLASGIHYVDVTGEIAVFEAIAERDADAKAAGVMLLPGAGFDVVPSDCLAAHVKHRLPGATRLRISIGGLGGVSRGTALTMLERAGRGTVLRRQGRLVEIAGAPRTTVDFGAGPRPAIGMSWGDVATAWRSTGIPDIEVFFEASPKLARAVTLSRLFRPLLSIGVVRGALAAQVRRRIPTGPTPERRARSRSVIVAQAWDDATGTSVRSRLITAEAYTLTAWTAVEIARRASSGGAVPGYQTPATAFGADFVLSFPQAAREDFRAASAGEAKTLDWEA
ncbi:MAG TPA: saccharopine dehydrogenase NADP-binding domain-containing protein [Candidatus Bathyarchaeia archaeon]|nr:saccharopine dehydrogenase NADP-binding domain-containing protein [Candidatus Bathyarchaeia archaeon]